eukprot:984770_1
MITSLLSVAIVLSIKFLCPAVSSYAYDDWITSTATFPRGDEEMAIAYNNITNTTWILGGSYNRYQLVSFDIAAGTAVDHGATNLTYQIRGTSQFYAQTNNILWMIEYGGRSFIQFNVDTLEIKYNYRNITFPIDVENYGCLTADSHYLYIVGGSHTVNNNGVINSESRNDVQMFSLLTEAWLDNVPSMNSRRRSHTCHILNDWLYAIAGQQATLSGSSPSTTSVERLSIPIANISNLPNQRWRSYSTLLPNRRYAFRSVVYESDIVVIGGCCSDRLTVYVIDTTIDPLSARSAGTLDISITQSASIVIYPFIYSFGGDNADINTYQYTFGTTFNPTTDPTAIPTNNPTSNPTTLPTRYPTTNPTTASDAPSGHPTTGPSSAPTTEILLVWIVKENANCPDGYMDVDQSSDHYGGYCQICPENTAGTFGTCLECDATKEPNGARTECVAIPTQEKEKFYATAEFEAIISVLSLLTGCGCIGALACYFRKRFCPKNEMGASTQQEATEIQTSSY